MARVRYLGVARNNCHLQFVACAMNMKRALVLQAVEAAIRRSVSVRRNEDKITGQPRACDGPRGYTRGVSQPVERRGTEVGHLFEALRRISLHRKKSYYGQKADIVKALHEFERQWPCGGKRKA
jgi:hypothetical protein